MRLINVETLRLEEFLDYKTPPYAILSHTWGDDSEELTFRDVEEGKVDKPGVGSVKLRGCCRQAVKDGLGYAWIDTCCIDKTNSVELGEAINSMFRWYRRASVCYAYLSDVPGDDNPRKPGSKLRTSRWFGRGWTLQELLAPGNLRFYNSEWHYLGTKGSMWAVIGKITGVPRQFLLGVTDLHSASVAQRMSWAAQRDTKRKEDLAYCLLGIFGVTMPMIYGEGGDQAFFRLQEQIMKTTGDDSILAWGLSFEEPPVDDSGQVAAGRVLAAAPSDFANSGQIASRETTAASPNSLDIYGGNLRIHLPLLTTPAGKTIGLLSCGPEHDAQQAVGIPLSRMASAPSDEYIRPEGCHSVLWPITASSVSPTLIHIKNNSQSKKPADTNQQYWLYDGDALTEVNLDLIDVAPRSCWHKERALIMSTIQSDNGSTHPTLARFRHDDEGSQDFVVVLELKQKGTFLEPECCVVTCCRDTSLEELAGKLQYVARKASGKRSASNGSLHLRVALESDVQQSMFTIMPEAMSHPPDVTIDATVELQKSDLVLEFGSILEEKGRNDAEEEQLSQMAKEKSSRLERIKTKREKVEDELRKLEGKRRLLIEEEGTGAEEMRYLSARQAGVRGRQEHASKRWSQARKRWDELWHVESGDNGYESERMVDQALLRWAVEAGDEAMVQLLLRGGQMLQWAAKNGRADVVKLLLDKGADVAVTDKDGRTPLSVASSEGHVDVVRLLLATGGANIADSKDRRYGLTPLSWAAASGCEAVVRLLLETSMVDIDSRDNNGQTPLRWAAKGGHKAVVQLLLEKGAASVEHRQTLQGHSGYVCAVVFSPDGKTLASASSDYTVRLWDAASGAHRQTLQGHNYAVHAIAFSLDGKTLASASSDRTVRLWDAASGAHRQTLQGHKAPVYAVAFSLDSKTLASASSDGTVRLWDAASGAHRQTLHGHHRAVQAIAFSLDGKTLASASSDRTVRLWDAASGAHRQTLQGHDDAVYAIAFSLDGKTLASASGDRTVRLWDAASGAHRQTLQGHGGYVYAVAFSLDGKTLASASNDGSRLWDAASGAHRRTLQGYGGIVRDVAFSPDGKTLASALNDYTVQLWNVDGGYI